MQIEMQGGDIEDEFEVDTANDLDEEDRNRLSILENYRHSLLSGTKKQDTELNGY